MVDAPLAADDVRAAIADVDVADVDVDDVPARVPAFDEDGTPAVAIEPSPARPAMMESAPALARLGAEGLLRLRARHAEVLARISEKSPDPARRDELKEQAERLNPDTWVTEAEVTAGLEQYETVFESLRSVVGRRRKRRRGRGAGGEGQPDGTPHEPAGSDAATEGDDDVER